MTKKNATIERVILWILILGAILSFGTSLLAGNSLLYTDYAGILAIFIAAVISFTKPEKSLGVLFIILVLGAFNLLGFVSFINLVFYIGKGGFVSPGIQMYSLLLLIFLVQNRKTELKELYHKNFSQSEEDYIKSRELAKNSFLKKFENLSDAEVVERLSHDLIPEAKEALNEIKEKRGL